MQIHADWHTALAAARRGDLEPARAARAIDSTGALPDFYYARCLAEAGVELDHAIDLLRVLAEARPANPLVPQVLALALARTGRPDDALGAARMWRRIGLPHATDLLGQVALTLEAQTRPWPARNPGLEVAWPESLGTRESFTNPIPPENPCDNLTPEPATKKPPLIARLKAWLPGKIKKQRIERVVSHVEDFLIEGKGGEALQLAMESIARGDESAELNTVAGMAADEMGDPARARAHLARALELDEQLLIARTHLGRVYWREGWFEPAMALWRSLPVEGPYDYGRHYHLALGYDALGRRDDAEKAMAVALSDFFYDMRHYYISQALRRWLAPRSEKPSETTAAPPLSAGPENA